MAGSTPTVLLVEDSEEDAFLLERALRMGELECDLRIAEDGQRALDYLSGSGPFADRAAHPEPSLMLLDLKLPYINGIEVLSWLTTQSALKDLKVIVLTSSDEERDRTRVGQLGVHAYHVKPPSRQLVADVAKVLQETHPNAAR